MVVVGAAVVVVGAAVVVVAEVVVVPQLGVPLNGVDPQTHPIGGYPFAFS